MDSTWDNFAVITAIIALLAFERSIRIGDRGATPAERAPLSRRAKLQYTILFVIVIVGGLFMLTWRR